MNSSNNSKNKEKSPADGVSKDLNKLNYLYVDKKEVSDNLSLNGTNLIDNYSLNRKNNSNNNSNNSITNKVNKSNDFYDYDKDNFLVVKQNSASNNIIKNFNNLRHLDEKNINTLGVYELQTQKGEIYIEVKKDELERIERKLKYTNLKKLYLYLTYRMTKDNQRTLKIKINELLELKGQVRDSRTIKRLIEDIKTLEKIKVYNYKANISNKEHNLEESFLFKFGKWTPTGEQYPTYFSVTAGAWADPLLDNNQIAHIPKEIFKFNKLEFDIAFNILTRFRNQLKIIQNKNKNFFTLTVEYLLKNVELNTRKYGSTKMIDKIEKVLSQLEELKWFTWSYRKNTRKDLPGRNKIEKYKEFTIDFNIEDSRLKKAYKL